MSSREPVDPSLSRRAHLPDRLVRALEAVPLRERLVLILAVLLIGALAVTSTASAWLLDRDLHRRIDDELRAAAEPVGQQGVAGIRTGSIEDVPTTYAFAYIPADGNDPSLIVPRGSSSPPALPPLSREDVVERGGQPFTVTSVDGQHRWRFIAGTIRGDDATFAVGVSLDDTETTVRRLVTLTWFVGLTALVLTLLLGWFAIHRAFRPLRRIEDVAAAIAGGDLTRRIPVRSNDDEVASLSHSLNVMLGRIENSFAAREASEAKMRQFVADASHELRTPLATVKGYAELYRQGAVSGPERLSQVMARIEGEAVRMSTLVDDLLMLARLDEERPLLIDSVDLLVLAAEATTDAGARAPRRTIRLVGLDGELEPVVVPGDDARLRQVLGNLLTNAITHTPDGTPIEVAIGTTGKDAILEVRDHGPGIDEATAQRVFERFFRADKARSRERGGSGLGLAIVAAIVGHHHGRVEVLETDGGGATFRVRLPLSPS